VAWRAPCVPLVFPWQARARDLKFNKLQQTPGSLKLLWRNVPLVYA